MRIRSILAIVAILVAACGSESESVFDKGSDSAPNEPSGGGSLGGGAAGDGGGGGATAAGCNKLSGKVYDPAGKTPLYGVAVYVPRGALPPIPEGASCSRCGATVSAYAAALTDASGSFSLSGVPDGDVRVVMESGKWRREVTVKAVGGCEDRKVDDPSLLRLPRNASEGSLPRIASVTGGADSLECLLRKIGIDDNEFGTAGDKAAHVHLYAGANGRSAFTSGRAFAARDALYASAATLKPYDMVLNNCAGRVEDFRYTKEAWVQAMEEYASQGGRAFFSHFMNIFVRGGSAALASSATIRSDNGQNLVTPFTADIDTSFPKGQAFSDWLGAVGGSATPKKIVLQSAQYTVSAVAKGKATPWIYAASAPNETGQNVGAIVQYLSVNLPVGSASTAQCGRYVLSDLHVGSDGGSGPFPSSCSNNPLTPQEKALEFMLFDLSACVLPDTTAPAPPVIR